MDGRRHEKKKPAKPVQQPSANSASSSPASANPSQANSSSASSPSDDRRFEKAELPKTAWVLHLGDTHVTNDRSLLVGARDCDESLYEVLSSKPIQVQAIGEVYLELQNNLTLRLKHVRYAPDAKYNLVSQTILTCEMGFSIAADEGEVHLGIKERSGTKMRFEVANMVGYRLTFLTKQPPIDYVIEFADAHPAPDAPEFVSLFTQDSGIGKSHRKIEPLHKGDGPPPMFLML